MRVGDGGILNSGLVVRVAAELLFIELVQSHSPTRFSKLLGAVSFVQDMTVDSSTSRRQGRKRLMFYVT